VDSEHCALWQCLNGIAPERVRRIALTASGGPFRDRALGTFSSITPDEALRHPTWRMGRKVTIDSATLTNKGYEVVEAHWLYGLPYDRIDVVLHPESVVHAMVELVDGSVIAQLAEPDMRLPIQYALRLGPRALPGAPVRLDEPAYPAVRRRRGRAVPLPRARPRIRADRRSGRDDRPVGGR